MARAARIASIVALAMIVIGGFEPFYLRIFAANGASMRAAFTELPYRKMPGLRLFLSGVDDRTPPGARIAICVPFTEWDGGYGYAYYRASYLLPGRQVVPIANVNEADFVACWHVRPALPRFEPVWQNADGVLLRRVR